MVALRSFILNTFFFGGGFLLGLLLSPCLLMTRGVMQWGLKFWSSSVIWGLKWIAGLTWEVRGLENVPDGACVFACKHQSAWETAIFYQLVNDPAYVLKKQLLSIPFFGWYLGKSGAIAIDRNAGASALKALVRGGRAAVERGQNVVIFPEGTRSEPDVPNPYHPGVAALYKSVDAPLVPVAVNSGLFWQRRSFLKRPGRAVIEFLPPIESGLDRRAFMAELQNRIDEATERLVAEGRERFPQALPRRSEPDIASDNETQS
ncbi:lysophospholipid acyltransferase family protein [Pseudomonadota bacterium]